MLGHVAGEIIFKDPQVLRWLGIPATTGMSGVEVDKLLELAAPAVDWLVHGLPWVLAAVLFGLGAWWDWSRPAATAIRSEPKKA